MADITVPLEEIPTDLENPVDLTTLPEAEAIAHIKELYSFVGRTPINRGGVRT